MQPLLQRLMEERFKLVIRREPKEMPVYTLTVAPTGARLTHAEMNEVDCRTSPKCHQVLGNRISGLQGAAVSMGDLVFTLEAGSDGPILDETGLSELFSMQIKPFATLKPLPVDLLADVPEDRRPPPEPYKPSLASILEKDFGLLLRPGRARVETIQIES